jgi:hypothetical protein
MFLTLPGLSGIRLPSAFSPERKAALPRFGQAPDRFEKSAVRFGGVFGDPFEDEYDEAAFLQLQEEAKEFAKEHWANHDEEASTLFAAACYLPRERGLLDNLHGIGLGKKIKFSDTRFLVKLIELALANPRRSVHRDAAALIVGHQNDPAFEEVRKRAMEKMQAILDIAATGTYADHNQYGPAKNIFGQLARDGELGPDMAAFYELTLPKATAKDKRHLNWISFLVNPPFDHFDKYKIKEHFAEMEDDRWRMVAFKDIMLAVMKGSGPGLVDLFPSCIPFFRTEATRREAYQYCLDFKSEAIDYLLKEQVTETDLAHGVSGYTGIGNIQTDMEHDPPGMGAPITNAKKDMDYVINNVGQAGKLQTSRLVETLLRLAPYLLGDNSETTIEQINQLLREVDVKLYQKGSPPIEAEILLLLNHPKAKQFLKIHTQAITAPYDFKRHGIHTVGGAAISNWRVVGLLTHDFKRL